jgi:hypothetical protein
MDIRALDALDEANRKKDLLNAIDEQSSIFSAVYSDVEFDPTVEYTHRNNDLTKSAIDDTNIGEIQYEDEIDSIAIVRA